MPLFLPGKLAGHCTETWRGGVSCWNAACSKYLLSMREWSRDQTLRQLSSPADDLQTPLTLAIGGKSCCRPACCKPQPTGQSACRERQSYNRTGRGPVHDVRCRAPNAGTDSVKLTAQPAAVGTNGPGQHGGFPFPIFRWGNEIYRNPSLVCDVVVECKAGRAEVRLLAASCPLRTHSHKILCSKAV